MIRKPSGFTFTEMLVALAINAVVFIVLIYVFAANIGYYKKSINTNRLNQQLQAAMAIMANDIRRAGYWGNAGGDVGNDQNNNPFMTPTTDISVNGSNNCILFTYDHNSDGALAAISSAVDDEHYGFQLSGQAIQARPPGATFACGSSNWENLTDPTVVLITNLTFTLTPTTVTTGPGSRGIVSRSVDISVTGQLTSDSTVTRTLNQHIRIRNDKFLP
jgi:type IV pilus assembly protein PilW